MLIAVDDSESATRAAVAAHRLFGDDARYTVISVSEASPVLFGTDALRAGLAYPLAVPGAGAVGGLPFRVGAPVDNDAADGDDMPALAGASEHVARDVARDAGITDAVPIGAVGDPAATIVEAADDGGADVIVVGRDERGWVSTLLAGSVSRTVMRRASVPVLIVN